MLRWLGLPVMVFMLIAILQQNLSHAQGFAPAPAANGPVSDGSGVDQGIAYLLLLLALAITYLVH